MTTYAQLVVVVLQYLNRKQLFADLLQPDRKSEIQVTVSTERNTVVFVLQFWMLEGPPVPDVRPKLWAGMFYLGYTTSNPSNSYLYCAYHQKGGSLRADEDLHTKWKTALPDSGISVAVRVVNARSDRVPHDAIYGLFPPPNQLAFDH